MYFPVKAFEALHPGDKFGFGYSHRLPLLCPFGLADAVDGTPPCLRSRSNLGRFTAVASPDYRPDLRFDFPMTTFYALNE